MKLDDVVFYALLRAAMVRKGLLMPTTEEEVERAEKEMEGIEIELPESLKDPQKILDRCLGVAQPGSECLPRTQEAAGSNPASQTKKYIGE